MRRAPHAGRLLGMLLVIGTITAGHLRAQQGDLESGVRSLYLRDLNELERKFVGLAETFTPAQYDWRPAETIRSVREVLALVIAENATLVPHAFGRPGMPPFPAGQAGFPEVLQRVATADKAQVVAWLRGSFAVVRESWTGAEAATLGRPHPFFGGDMPASRIAITLIVDQHEHLGQLIAYARINGVVPPWSRP